MDKLTLIRTKLADLPTEEALREWVLVPLFRKMGFCDVTLTHGAEEDGKDIVFYTEDETQERLFTSVVAKAGNISGAVTKKSSDTTQLLQTILNQVKLSFQIPYNSVGSKRKERIGRVWVITNGTIKPAARRHIAEGLDPIYQVHVKFIEGDQLSDWINKYWPEFGSELEPNLQHYFDNLLAKFGTLSELKTLGYQKTKDLLDVFVTPTLVEERPRPPTREVVMGLKPPVEYIHHTTQELLGLKRVWIEGPGGSGKSTLIRSLILDVLEHNKLAPDSLRVPVALEFNEMVSAFEGRSGRCRTSSTPHKKAYEVFGRGPSGFQA